MSLFCDDIAIYSSHMHSGVIFDEVTNYLEIHVFTKIFSKLET